MNEIQILDSKHKNMWLCTKNKVRHNYLISFMWFEFANQILTGCNVPDAIISSETIVGIL